MKLHPSSKNLHLVLVTGIVGGVLLGGLYFRLFQKNPEKVPLPSAAHRSEERKKEASASDAQSVPPAPISPSLSDEHLLALSLDIPFVEQEIEARVLSAQCGFNDPMKMDRPASQVISDAAAGKLSYSDFELAFRAKQAIPLKKSDVAEIFALLESEPQGVDSALYHALANDAIRTLVQNKGLEPEGNWERYRSLLLSPSTPPVIADYMVQHLDYRHQTLQHSDEVESTLFAALQLSHGTIDGAALLVLKSLYEGNRMISSLPLLKHQVLVILSEKDRALVSRMAALDLADDLELAEAVEPTLSLLKRASLNYPGHLVAANLVRRLGTDDQVHQLTLIKEKTLNTLLVRAIRQSENL